MDEVIAIGDCGLYGLLSRPSTPSNAPAVVLFNPGLVHRVGPSRLNVRLARALADSGRVVLRLDLPGAGDVLGATDVSWLQAAHLSLDTLQTHAGTTRFVVGGLCSAADLAWQLAFADKRVCGLLAFDGLARRGFWFHVGELGLLLRRSPRQWPQMLRRRWRRKDADAQDLAAEDLRDWPEPGIERAQAEQLAARGVHIFALYTGGAAPYFLHRRQFAATFGSSLSGLRAQLEFWPDCDHAFYAAYDRNRLIVAVRDWLARHCVA